MPARAPDGLTVTAMRAGSYPILAPEGRWHIGIALCLGALGTGLWGGYALPLWALALFVLNFFRDPKRVISTEPGAVVSPASGKVVAIVQQPNPYLDAAPSLKVSVFMNVFSVHSNLIPIGGTVQSCRYHAGRFVNAALDKASLENERNAVQIRTDRGEDIVSVQIAGLVARRILCYVSAGEQVSTGDRYGFIRFGSRVDLYLPGDVRLNVSMGQRVSSGNDVIGYLPR